MWWRRVVLQLLAVGIEKQDVSDLKGACIDERADLRIRVDGVRRKFH